MTPDNHVNSESTRAGTPAPVSAGLTRRLLAVAAAFAALGCAFSRALSAADDKWWPDYAGGPASSRYFPSAQITRSNVGRLTVAWTYPFGETGFNPIVVRAVIYGRGRNGAIVALEQAKSSGRADRSAARFAAVIRCTRSTDRTVLVAASGDTPPAGQWPDD